MSNSDDYWYVPTPSRKEMRAAWPRKRVGRMVVRELPAVEAILAEHWLCRDTWKFFRRLGIGHPLDWVIPMGRETPDGYRVVHMLGFSWPEHRLIWKVVTSRDPVGVIDHKNGVRNYNAFENLRDVSPRENALNSVRGRFREYAEVRDAAVKAKDQAERQARKERRERRERNLLAKLKAKYDN